MLLHRYFGSHGFETLKEAKLKTSRVSTFNDPFEFLWVQVGKMTAKNARNYILSRRDSPEFLEIARSCFPSIQKEKDLKRTIRDRLPQMVINLVKNFDMVNEESLKNRELVADKNARLICFTDPLGIKPLDEILVWSHYANKHKGIRIGFEFPGGIKHPFKIVKVAYQAKRVEIDLSLGAHTSAVQKALVDSMKVKSKAWEYEQEFRLFTNPHLCEIRTMDDSTLEHFIGFKREWVKSVDFGVRCPKGEIDRIVDLLKADYSRDVLFHKAEFHKSDYSLEYKII